MTNTQPAEIVESTLVPRLILVVDDDEVIRSLVRDSLEREGFDMCVAGDGQARCVRWPTTIPIS